MALLKTFYGNTIPFTSLSGTAVYNSGFGIAGYGELSGFISSTGQPIHSSGTFSSPCIGNRTGTFTLDTRYVDYFDISVIAGNDKNGGERPNDNNESFFLIPPSGVSLLLAPSKDASGLGENNYDNTYGVWRTVRYFLAANEKSSSATFRFQQSSGCSSEWRDGVPQSVRDANQNARDRFGAQSIQLNGTVPNASVVSFSTNKSSICPNESVTLSWTTSNSSDVTIFVDNVSIGNFSSSGSRTISRTNATTYYIRANGITYYDVTGNSANSSNITVGVKPSTSASFTTNKTSMINNGTDGVTLSWSTSNATNVSINQGVGSNLGSSGSRTVQPTATTTYTITVSGECNSYTQSITITVYQPPTISSFTTSNQTICRGSSASLSWSVSGLVSSVSINQGIGSVGTSGPRIVSPFNTTQYTLTATGIGGTTTRNLTINVLQPTTTTLSLDSPTIIRGQSTTLNWVTTGDANSASITPGIGAVNINGNRVVSPTVTTTYEIYVDGICVDSSDSITLVVYQPPTVNLTGPVSINYGQQATLTYSTTNVDISLTITPTYNYKNTTTNGVTINLPISNNPGGVQINIPYNDFGPTSVTYDILATGNGGQEAKQLIIPINIDETPTNFLIPESEELLKSQEPIVTPDAVVTSYEILIDDIDIPVEVKADRPILVEINNTDTWIPIRNI